MQYEPSLNTPATLYDSRNNSALSTFSCFRLTHLGTLFAVAANQTYTLVHYNPQAESADMLKNINTVFGLLPGDWIVRTNFFLLFIILNGLKNFQIRISKNNFENKILHEIRLY